MEAIEAASVSRRESAKTLAKESCRCTCRHGVCVPDFQRAVHAGCRAHASVEWIPMNTTDGILVRSELSEAEDASSRRAGSRLRRVRGSLPAAGVS